MREGVMPADPERAAALEVVHLLRDVALRLELAVGEFARTTGLHGTDVRALIRLLDAERAGAEATPSWLAQQLGMTSQATTAVIHRLEAAGHVERLRSRSDGRSAQLQVSDSAVELGWQFFGPLLNRMAAETATLSPADQAALKRWLTAMAQAIG
ncbi:MarR family winged helix-turn-helix transcriptional regulator [Kribbella sp.]|uniref:MarR family winged helix-turn-helix transcriptional regulator n=1 Tax=Kribbella sp. TaxID=1871183 RepID=UPI002D500D7C|nr:MarR family transcriptional regulator [Kribbella sp.]HZX03897.1 MarR family transcriptional regulator [Kribbella sp.]